MFSMNDYIFTCERSNITSTFVAFFGQNRCFMSVRRYFQPNRPQKIIFNFFDRCETLPLILVEVLFLFVKYAAAAISLLRFNKQPVNLWVEFYYWKL